MTNLCILDNIIYSYIDQLNFAHLLHGTQLCAQQYLNFQIYRSVGTNHLTVSFIISIFDLEVWFLGADKSFVSYKQQHSTSYFQKIYYVIFENVFFPGHKNIKFHNTMFFISYSER